MIFNQSFSFRPFIIVGFKSTQEIEEQKNDDDRFDIEAVVRRLWIDGGALRQHVQAPDAVYYKCGNSMAERRSKCYECSTPITRLIRVRQVTQKKITEISSLIWCEYACIHMLYVSIHENQLKIMFRLVATKLNLAGYRFDHRLFKVNINWDKVHIYILMFEVDTLSIYYVALSTPFGGHDTT